MTLYHLHAEHRALFISFTWTLKLWKQLQKVCRGGSHYRRETVCVWEWVLSFKLHSAVLSHCRLVGSPACEDWVSFSSGNKSFTSSVSADLTGCFLSLTSPFSSSSGSLTLCTMKRCLLRDSTDVKHRPQWRHWGVFSSVLCWGICCWNCVSSSVMKPHFEQRNWVFSRFAEGASRLPARSCPSSCVPTAGFRNMSPLPEAVLHSWMDVFGIWPRSGFLIPCIRLMWFFNITLVLNIVFVSVQYQQV